jgi:glycosyltransferase involved in cell wall biosynthesis
MSGSVQALDPRRTFSDYHPLVTIALVSHDGDVQFLKRAVESLKAQTLPASLMEVVLAYDGPLEGESASLVEEAFKGCKFPVRVFWSDDKSGYYTLPRNRVFPMLRGLYVVHMDADNEFLPEHLWTLLNAIRNPGEGDEGWPHFAYTRRTYVNDTTERRRPAEFWYWDQGESDWRLEGYTSAGPYPTPPPFNSPGEAAVNWEGRPIITTPQGWLPEGPSPLVLWTQENLSRLVQSPQNNFVDTGDFIIGRSTLYELAERTGYVWHPDIRRFGDWELVKRMALVGFRGKAIDAMTHRYHWTGKNVSTNSLSDFVAIPEDVYESMKAEGKILE